MFVNRFFNPTLAIGALFGLAYLRKRSRMADCKTNQTHQPPFLFPKRSEMLENLKKELFDVVIIGGGATGSGVAYAAASRGLKVGLVERNDFGSGTSCKSTKLVHGGVRYLQKAVLHLDYDEYKLVTESLHERTLLMKNCPNMVTPVPILLPCSNPFDYMFKKTGLTLYEFISKDPALMCKYVPKADVEKMFPFLNIGKWGCGILYYDGQFDDARMDLTVIKTAILNGASACNYLNVENIQKVNDIYELTIFDKETQKVFKTKAKFVVNATGPYTDGIRKMIDPSAQEICKPSTGIHLSMPKNMTDHNVGILINESHNRVLFVLPWEGTTIVGTTDTPATIQERPLPTKKELESVLDRLSVIIDKNITTINNVKSCWSGIRPLVIDPNATKGDTASISRSHLIQQTGNFITISGGKWTIFRKMGKDVVDKISGTKSNDSEPDVELKLYNCIDWTPQVTQQLIEKFKAPEDIAKHLSRSFGVEALDIANIRGGFNRLHPEYPYTEEELIHICKNEYVCSLEDIISRRTRLAFIDVPATIEILDKVSNIVKSELKWSDNKVQIELEKCKKFLNEDMGYDLLRVKTQ